MDKIDKIDNVEFYKDIYLFEIARKENLNSKISTYIGLLTVIGGIVVFELENLYQNLNVNPIIQFELIVMIMIILEINIYNLYKANHGKEYKYLDNSIEVRKAFVELERYYQQYYEYFKNEEETIDCLIERKKKEKLIEIYIKCSEENAKVNDIRNEETMKFINFFIISLIIVGIIGIYCITVKKPIDINILY